MYGPDRNTFFAQGLSNGSAEATAGVRGHFDLSEHVAERRAAAADCAQQHVARRVDVRFGNTPNILQQTLYRIVRTFYRDRKTWLLPSRAAPASDRDRQLLRRSRRICCEAC